MGCGIWGGGGGRGGGVGGEEFTGFHAAQEGVGGAKKNDVRELGDHYLHVAKSENQVLRIGKALADRPKSQRSRRA